MSDNHEKSLRRISFLMNRIIPNLKECPQYNCKIIGEPDNFVIINKEDIPIKGISQPNNKELRLMMDILKQEMPKYQPSWQLKFIFGIDIPTIRIINPPKSFKDIIKKTTIGGDRKLHTRIRYRQPF